MGDIQVKGSGNLCGLAEMDGPVDFEASAVCWDRNWKGKFPVKWHIVKDVPYNQFQQLSIVYSREIQPVSITV